MATRDEEFEEKLLATFRVEAEEHIRTMSARLVDLEKTVPEGEREGVIEVIFREAHSLKGAARAVNAIEVESICQSLESILSALKHRTVAVTPALFDLLHSSVDAVSAVITLAEHQPSAAANLHIVELSQTLEKVLQGALPPASQSQSNEAAPSSPAGSEPILGAKVNSAAGAPSAFLSGNGSGETVRVSAEKLNSLMLQVEELRAPKLALGQHLAELRELCTNAAAGAQEAMTVRSQLQAICSTLERHQKAQKNGYAFEASQRAVSRMEQLTALVKRNSENSNLLSSAFASLLRRAELDQRTLSGMVSALLEETRKLSLVPFSSLLEGAPKLVRDLCRDQGKDVELTITGSEIEAERQILEELKDPFIHLLRNCVDHGIESPGERKSCGKPPKGRISISITPKDGDKVEILVSDDGGGIDLDKVRVAAAAMGGASTEQISSLADGDALSLVFQSGLSTSPIITNLSGRGLGLAIAREKIEKLGGTLTVESRHSAGTSFSIVLPVTLATLRGVLVRSAELVFVVPTRYVERVIRVDSKAIKTVENRETIRYEGTAISLARLRNVLELSSASIDSSRDKLHVLILRAAGERIAFLVDEILSEQEVLAKPLGQQLSRVRNLAGATVLGTGKMAPILHVHDLMKSAVESGGVTSPPPDRLSPTRGRSILIAEDSITSRTLLKNILQSAGYEVKTAVDGFDAYTLLREGRFDLVVSDVEMPRMTGFDLTAKIRADKKLSETPVVLVTGLASPEDRERGIDVGANAYMVKSSFDHSDLLQIIQRLI